MEQKKEQVFCLEVTDAEKNNLNWCIDQAVKALGVKTPFVQIYGLVQKLENAETKTKYCEKMVLDFEKHKEKLKEPKKEVKK